MIYPSWRVTQQTNRGTRNQISHGTTVTATTQGKGSDNYHTVEPLQQTHGRTLQQWQHPIANAATVRGKAAIAKVTAASTEVTAAQQIREGCG